MPFSLFTLAFESSESGLKMRFRKDAHQVKQKLLMFGKNIIITDNTDWTTREILEASLDRWQIEDRFRQSKNNEKTVLGHPLSSMIIGICVFVLFHVFVLLNFIAFKRFEWLEHMPRWVAVGTVPLILAAVLLMLYFCYRFYKFLNSESSTGNRAR